MAYSTDNCLSTGEQMILLERVTQGLTIDSQDADLLRCFGYVKPNTDPSCGSDWIVTTDGARKLRWWLS